MVIVVIGVQQVSLKACFHKGSVGEGSGASMHFGTKRFYFTEAHGRSFLGHMPQ